MKSLLILLITFITSIEPSKTEMRMNIDITTDIYISDLEGNDLLNPNKTHPKSIDLDKLKLFYIIDEKEVEVNKPHLDASRGFLLLTPESNKTRYSLRIFLNIESQEEITTTILKWNKDQSDIIKSKIQRDQHSILCTKLIINDILAWNNEGERSVCIIR